MDEAFLVAAQVDVVWAFVVEVVIIALPGFLIVSTVMFRPRCMERTLISDTMSGPVHR